MQGTLLLALPALALAEESVLVSWLVKLGKLRSGSPKEFPEGKTWGELTFLERVRVYDWSTEIYVLIMFAALIGFYTVGKNANERKVNKFFDAVKPVLRDHFALVGATPRTQIVKDSDTRYTTYASGRVNVRSLLARFRLIDRQSVMNYTVGLVVPSLASSDGKPDHIEITITPSDPKGIEPGIFAIANKNNLQEAQEDSFFLSLTKPVESDKLPSPAYIFLSEHNDQIDALYTPDLNRALSLEGASNVFKWLAFSDVPSKEPTTEQTVSQSQHITLMLGFPKSAEEEEACRQIVDAAINLVDVLVAKPAYRGSTLKRIRASRDAIVAKIRRAEEKAKQEELEAKKAEERREAARRERNLSEKEQRKLQKKEQEKQARKQRQKMTRRS